MIYLEHKNPNVNRYVQLSLENKKVHVRSGSIGFSQQSVTLAFNNHHEAEQVYSHRLLKLYSKGYRRSCSDQNKAMMDVIVKDPDDYSNYLVYSDLLQMQHNPRGELIAVQHQRELDPDKKSLIQQESDILRVHKHLSETWWGEKSYFSWNMGFIKSAIYNMNHNLNEAGWIRRMLMHPSFQFLRRFCLFNTPPNSLTPEVLRLLNQSLPQTVYYLEFCNSNNSPYGINIDSTKPYVNISNVSNLVFKGNHIYNRRLATEWLTN